MNLFQIALLTVLLIETCVLATLIIIASKLHQKFYDFFFKKYYQINLLLQKDGTGITTLSFGVKTGVNLLNENGKALFLSNFVDYLSLDPEDSIVTFMEVVKKKDKKELSNFVIIDCNVKKKINLLVEFKKV